MRSETNPPQRQFDNRQLGKRPHDSNPSEAGPSIDGRHDASRWLNDSILATPAEDRFEMLAKLLGADVCRRKEIFPLPRGFLLSVVIPVYNEQATLPEVVDRVERSGVPCEIIFVDDGSTDGVAELLNAWQERPHVVVERHAKNLGKGAALRTGFARARGNAIIVQDADLEYDPDDYWRLVQPIVEDRADVVYGSRFRGTGRQSHFCWHTLANRLLTAISNLRTGLRLSDMETCYKIFRREIIERIAPTLRESRFGIEPEITAKIARIRDIRICEVPIRYAARSYRQGKKINWRDGLRALWCIVRY